MWRNGVGAKKKQTAVGTQKEVDLRAAGGAREDAPVRYVNADFFVERHTVRQCGVSSGEQLKQSERFVSGLCYTSCPSNMHARISTRTIDGCIFWMSLVGVAAGSARTPE